MNTMDDKKLTAAEIELMIKGAQLVYKQTPYWQEKAREDVLNAIYPIEGENALENYTLRSMYEYGNR